MLKRLFHSFLAGVTFMLGIGAVAVTLGVVHAANPIALFTGPAGTNPAQNPPIVGDLNTILNGVNNELANWLTLGNAGETGEVALTSKNAFSNVGSSTASLSGTALSGHTVVSEWLAVVDENGYVGYVPVF